MDFYLQICYNIFDKKRKENLVEFRNVEKKHFLLQLF